MGLKSFIRSIIYYTKEEKIVPIERWNVNVNEFEQKVALITGGSGGIGLEIAKGLLEVGCKVIIAGTSETKLKAVLASLNSEKAVSIVVNYNNIDNLKEKIDEAANVFGRIDFFISSAGVHTENVDFWNMVPDEFERVMRVNLEGTYFACQAVGAYMVENRIKGRILLISSSRGSEPAWSPYGISKWGIKGLSLGLSKMLAPHGITVNTIAPGSTATSLVGYNEGDNIFTTENDAHRLVMPKEVGELAKFLLSDAGRMIVGETIHIAAGRGTYDIR